MGEILKREGDRRELDMDEGMSEWREYTLGDFAEIQTGPFGSQLHASDYVNEGIPSIMPTNIGGRLEIKTENIACIKDEDAKRLKKYLIKENDIVYSRRGDVEKCAFITEKESGWLCGTGCLRVRFVFNEISPKFCAYYLSTDEVKSWVSGNAVGTTMPNLNSSILQRLPLNIPPLPEQKAIASILSSLDDKIDLLHRQNRTLEAISETLFRQWFIEEAQANWDVQPLGNLVTVKRGGSPRPIQDFLSEAGYRWLKISDATKENSPFIFEIKEHIKESGLSKTTLLKDGSLVLSNSATPGVPKILQVDSCIHDGWLHFPESYFSNEFLYLLFKSIRLELISQGNGSVFTNLKTDIIKDYQIPIPEKDQLQVFQDSVELIFKKILINANQIRTLEKLRDNLLPKLMSGEVQVKLSTEE
jgi:type I restriction enzyme, S subunit